MKESFNSNEVQQVKSDSSGWYQIVEHTMVSLITNRKLKQSNGRRAISKMCLTAICAVSWYV